MSYWISARHRGNGYATRALSLLCGYAFSIGITRLEAHVAPDNYASRAVAEHAGFAGHGTFTGDGGQPLVRYSRTAAPGLNARARIIRIKPMRRESSTVVALVGDVGDGLLAGLVKSPGVSVVRAGAGTREPDESAGAEQRPAWEAGALALGEATRHQSMYVIVPEDPLAGVAAGWRAMWDLSAGPGGGAGFEQQAADALAAWRNKRFELPDYYLVVAPPQASAAGPDLYLGPLRSVRPRRVAVAGVAQGPAQLPVLVDTLTSLQHGPWWPPLNELLDAARGFYAGGLAETQPRPGVGG